MNNEYETTKYFCDLWCEAKLVSLILFRSHQKSRYHTHEMPKYLEFSENSHAFCWKLGGIWKGSWASIFTRPNEGEIVLVNKRSLTTCWHQVRYSTKYNHSEGCLVVKMTDDVVCLQYKTDAAQDVKKMDKFVNNLMRHMASKEQHWTPLPNLCNVSRLLSLFAFYNFT